MSGLTCMKRQNEKSKGELAEMAFHIKAKALGLSVSKPYGDNEAFDFTVYRLETGSLRVQVRSAWSLVGIAYNVRIDRSGRAEGNDRGFDYLAVYIVPHDAWYIVPADEVPRNRKMAYFFPHVLRSRGKYEGFKNAWHFLTGRAADDTRLIGLTIHAGADKSG